MRGVLRFAAIDRRRLEIGSGGGVDDDGHLQLLLLLTGVT